MANSWCWVESLGLRADEYAGSASRATARGDLVIGACGFM
jgi:hypothetical protein